MSKKPRAKFKGRFPRAIFAVNKTIGEQIEAIALEVIEVSAAHVDLMNNNTPFGPKAEHLAMEALDVIHSAETLLHILEDRHGVDVNAMVERVKIKNELRGYYSMDIREQ